ncbi:MAG: hypothetical protein LUQ25_03790 [Methanoregulaceae archaeon]|nr:hypothetical protein [Methanoregulaceae archaeon]
MSDAFPCTCEIQERLSKEVVAENLKDSESDMKGQVKYQGICRTPGKFDTIVMFEASNEKVAMNMALRRLDRMDTEKLVVVPADEGSPAGPT